MSFSPGPVSCLPAHLDSYQHFSIQLFLKPISPIMLFPHSLLAVLMPTVILSLNDTPYRSILPQVLPAIFSKSIWDLSKAHTTAHSLLGAHFLLDIHTIYFLSVVSLFLMYDIGPVFGNALRTFSKPKQRLQQSAFICIQW